MTEDELSIFVVGDDPGTTERDAITQLRLSYMLNGYAPLPSYGKAKPIFNWKNVHGTPEMCHRWHRSRKLTTTCIRLDPPLAVVDIDVNDPIADDICNLLFQIAGAGPQLVRHGAGFKLAIFVRSEKPFTRHATRHFLRPGEALETLENKRYRVVTANGTVVGGGQQVELFGGKSARYFGAAGPHSYHGDGTVAVAYRWGERSPENTPLVDLPVLSEEQWYEFLARSEALFKSRGWTAILRSQTIKGDEGSRAGINPHASPKQLAEALSFIPAAEGYDEWNKVGMAIYRATGGSREGLAVWDAWSKKAQNYGGTSEKWNDYEKSPPMSLGAGTIFYLADQGCDCY